MQRGPPMGLDGVNWDDIGLVAALAEFDSLRQASKAFGVNASTLVRRVERLEASLGTTILDRLPHGAQLNAAGRAIAEVARDMKQHFLRLQDVARLDHSAQGKVRVAVTEGLGTFCLAPRLPAFAAAHPEILFDMESSMDLRNLPRNEADIAIQLRRPENPEVVAMRLCHLHIYPFAALSYVEAHGLPTLADNRRHRLVLQESEQITNEVIFAFLAEHGVRHDVAFMTNSSVAHLYAIEKGLGIGGLPTFAMAMGAPLIPLDLGFSHSTDVWICYRPEMRKVKRVSLVIDWLRQAFDPKRHPWFAPDFIHPAELMERIDASDRRPDIFDSRLIRTHLSAERPVERPPARETARLPLRPAARRP